MLQEIMTAHRCKRATSEWKIASTSHYKSTHALLDSHSDSNRRDINAYSSKPITCETVHDLTNPATYVEDPSTLFSDRRIVCRKPVIKTLFSQPYKIVATSSIVFLQLVFLIFYQETSILEAALRFLTLVALSLIVATTPYV
jgi:hypothetical protein